MSPRFASPGDDDRRDGPLLALAAVAAFGAAILAIRQHSETTSLGYSLAAAQREGEVLEREAARAERRVSALRSPSAVLARRTTSLRSLDGLAHQHRVPELPFPSTTPSTTPATVPAPVPARRTDATAGATAGARPQPLRTSDVSGTEGRRP